MSIKISFAKPKKPAIVIRFAPSLPGPQKPQGFTFMFDPKQDRDPGPWWAADRGHDGEPLPLKEGEVAVVKLWYMEESGWKFILSNGKKHIRKKFVGVGWDDNLKDSVTIMLPSDTEVGAEKQYRNAIPKKMRDAAHLAHSKYLKEEEEKTREIFSRLTR